MGLRIFKSCVCSCVYEERQRKKKRSSYEKRTNASLKSFGYDIGKQIGVGAYSTVHEAYSPTQQRVAVKIIDKRKLVASSLRILSKYFDQEMQIQSKLDDVNIIKLFDTMEVGSKLYIFMELAEGGDLLEFINTHGLISETRSKRLFRELCMAVYHCHINLIAHRDLKCENVLLSKDMKVKLSDFGFACYCHKMSETYCGSAAYSAPEIIQEKPYNPMLSDSWSLGVILFTMVSATMPFEETNLNRLVTNQLRRNWHFPRHAIKILSEEVMELVADILEPDAKLRPSVTQIIESRWLSPSAVRKTTASSTAKNEV